MINAIIQGIFNLVIGLVNTLLYPIDALINATMPAISSALSYVSGFFQWLSNLLPWAISWFGLDSSIILLLVGYLTFKYTAPLIIHTIKLALKWYNKLKI